jgi:hypothetical protein
MCFLKLLLLDLGVRLTPEIRRRRRRRRRLEKEKVGNNKAFLEEIQKSGNQREGGIVLLTDLHKNVNICFWANACLFFSSANLFQHL